MAFLLEPALRPSIFNLLKIRFNFQLIHYQEYKIELCKSKFRALGVHHLLFAQRSDFKAECNMMLKQFCVCVCLRKYHRWLYIIFHHATVIVFSFWKCNPRHLTTYYFTFSIQLRVVEYERKNFFCDIQ